MLLSVLLQAAVMEEMIATAKETSQELGKLDGLTQEEALLVGNSDDLRVH